jgi:hypothetical protein
MGLTWPCRPEGSRAPTALVGSKGRNPSTLVLPSVLLGIDHGQVLQAIVGGIVIDVMNEQTNRDRPAVRLPNEPV